MCTNRERVNRHSNAEGTRMMFTSSKSNCRRLTDRSQSPDAATLLRCGQALNCLGESQSVSHIMSIISHAVSKLQMPHTHSSAHGWGAELRPAWAMSAPPPRPAMARLSPAMPSVSPRSYLLPFHFSGEICSHLLTLSSTSFFNFQGHLKSLGSFFN